MAISTVGMENQLQPGHETGARSGQVLPLFANHLVFGDFGPGWFRQYHFFANTHMMTATLPQTKVELQAGFSKHTPNTES